MNISTPGSGSACKLVVLLSGNGSNLQAIIDRIEAGELNASIVGVISNKSDAHGLDRARKHHLPATTVIAEPEETRAAYDARLQAAIDSYQADWIIMAGFMRILSAGLVMNYAGRMINIHPSLLPKFKGLNTHQRVLEAGESVHGASVHFVTPTLDDGPVIMQSQINVDSTLSAEQLKQKVHTVEHQIYPDVIQLLCQKRVSYLNGQLIFDNQPMKHPLNNDKAV